MPRRTVRRTLAIHGNGAQAVAVPPSVASPEVSPRDHEPLETMPLPQRSVSLVARKALAARRSTHSQAGAAESERGTFAERHEICLVLTKTEGRMSTVLEVLRDKGTGVFTIEPNATVFEAIGHMVRLGVGSLVVMENDCVVGMITERDYLRKVAIEGRTSRTTLVREIMSTPVLTVRLSEDINHCLALITEHRVRHLPVIEGGRLLGLVSMGDLVRQKVIDQQGEIERLVDYIQTSGAVVAY